MKQYFLKPGKTDASRVGVTGQRKCTANYTKTQKQSKPMPILLWNQCQILGRQKI